MSGKVFLKIKVKSLAEEARLIRDKEVTYKYKKAWAPLVSPETGDDIGLQRIYIRVPVKTKHIATLDSLHNHRTQVVRKEARDTQIAYAFIRGRDAKSVVPQDKRKLDKINVLRMAMKYGPVDLQNLPKNHEAVLGYEKKLLDWFKSV